MRFSRSSRVAAAALAGSLLALTLLPLATPVFAQDAGMAAQRGDTGRETEFVAMTGPARDSVPGGALLIAAYAVIWVLLCGYVGRLAMLQGQTSKELARLDTALRAHDGAEPTEKKTGEAS